MIKLDNITVVAGNFRLKEVSLEVARGQYAMLMGRTGSGKTTLLEAICGLRRVESGAILLDDEDVTHWRPGMRGVGFVPQEGALFSTMTVYEHLAFALRVRQWQHREIKARVEAVAEQLAISALLPRHPLGLSGGERQRVALGRALTAQPKVLCLDEPLSALDYETRADMCALLERIKTETGVTVLHITHDRSEAARLADQVIDLSGGRVNSTAAVTVQQQ
jgi:molybdate/tungstate transport system ATP-binding protein